MRGRVGDGPVRAGIKARRDELIENRRGGAMNKDRGTTAAKRRDFLNLAGLGTLGGAAAATVGAAAVEAKDESGERASGYRETAHVKKVYELARF